METDLLTTITGEINRAGGRVAMMKIIMNENRPYFKHSDWVDLNNRISKHNYMKKKRETALKSDKIWTNEDVNYVLEKFGIIRTSLIAEILGRTVYAIQNCFRMKASESDKERVRLTGKYKGRVNNFKK